jgi:hypothetical protein
MPPQSHTGCEGYDYGWDQHRNGDRFGATEAVANGEGAAANAPPQFQQPRPEHNAQASGGVGLEEQVLVAQSRACAV